MPLPTPFLSRKRLPYGAERHRPSPYSPRHGEKSTPRDARRYQYAFILICAGKSTACRQCARFAARTDIDIRHYFSLPCQHIITADAFAFFITPPLIVFAATPMKSLTQKETKRRAHAYRVRLFFEQSRHDSARRSIAMKRYSEFRYSRFCADLAFGAISAARRRCYFAGAR